MLKAFLIVDSIRGHWSESTNDFCMWIAVALVATLFVDGGEDDDSDSSSDSYYEQ